MKHVTLTRCSDQRKVTVNIDTITLTHYIDSDGCMYSRDIWTILPVVLR